MNKHDEIMTELEHIRSAIDVLVEALASQTKVDRPDSDTMHCPAYPGELMYKRTGPYGDFYSHGKQVGPGRWVNCHGRGWGMNKAEE